MVNFDKNTGFYASTRTRYNRYTSYQQAVKAEDDAAQSDIRGRAILAQEATKKLTREELQAIIEESYGETDRKLSQKIGEDAIKSFIANHPEFVSEGVVGTRNGSILCGYLLAQGKAQPFHNEDLEAAFEYLVSVGQIALTGEPKKSEEQLTEDELYALPMDELIRRANGFVPGSF